MAVRVRNTSVRPDTPHILLINPWIHDFAAYDFWAKPLGLLMLAGILRRHGFRVSYLDCLDRFHRKAPPSNPYARHGRGPYRKTRIPKPAVFADIPRNFSRYGIDLDWFRQDLAALARPDIVLMTSLMTYWYPGVQEAVRMTRNAFADTPIVLGGIYATLCRRHALLHSEADRVVGGPAEREILDLVGRCTGFSVKPRFDPEEMDSYPYPAFDLQSRISCVPLLTSRGCPFACDYCASHLLFNGRMKRKPEAVAAEIAFWHRAHGVRDFVFYDDALLLDADRHAVPLFEAVIRAGLQVHFHLPNAVHIRGISGRAAELMYRAGFKTVRLGLETADFSSEGRLDAKVTAAEFVRALALLKKAGFRKDQVGAYLLVGLPGQSFESISASIAAVRESGITPVPAYYSPIPQTPLWGKAAANSRYPLAADPLYTNNAVLPCVSGGFCWKAVSRLKDLAAGIPE